MVILFSLLIKALKFILDSNPRNISQGGLHCLYSLHIHVTFISIQSPREDICAFDVGVISAFSVGEPVLFGDEIVSGAAQPPPQSQQPRTHSFLQPQPAAFVPVCSQWASVGE